MSFDKNNKKNYNLYARGSDMMYVNLYRKLCIYYI